MHTGVGDSASMFTQAVSPVPLAQVGTRGIWLLRPAALVQAIMAKPLPRLFKTHFANLELPGLPPFIPKELTAKAIYIVRDPRSVILSLSKFYSLDPEKAVANMNRKDFCIGMDLTVQTPTLLSTWTNHVSSWTAATVEFPVHLVKYEDLCANPEAELAEILKFLDTEVDEARVKRACTAARLSRLRKEEEEKGFAEYANSGYKGKFFDQGGTRWKQELGKRWRKQLEKDHGELMELLEYKTSVSANRNGD